MGILSPLYGWAMLLLLPIVALYLLKPRSEHKLVSNTFLWQKTAHALNSERLDKKLIRHWLFYLQMATIIIATLLLMHPYLNRTAIKSDETVLIVDTSASMSTRADGQTRLEAVKVAAVELIKALEGNPVVTVYALNDVLEQAYHGESKDRAIDAIEAMEQTEMMMSEDLIRDVLSSYDTMASEYGIYVFTDHVLMADEGLQYYLATQGLNHVGIQNVTMRYGDDEALFRVTLKNALDSEIQGELLIYGDDALIKIIEVGLEGSESKILDLALDGRYQGVSFKWGLGDDYLLDNTYYVSLARNDVKRILISGDSNRFLEEAFMIFPNVEVYKSDDVEVNGDYDLYVYNGRLPKVLPEKGGLMIINPKEDRDYLSLGKRYTSGQLSFDSSDRLWRHVKPTFNVKEVMTIETPFGENIMTIDDMPVMLKGQLEGHQALVIGLDFMNTDFPIRVGFPVFVYNSVTYLIGDLTRGEVQGIVGHDLSIYASPSATERFLVDQAGDSVKLEEGYMLDLELNKSGFYCLEELDDHGSVERKWLSANVSRDELVNFKHVDSDNLNVITHDVLRHQSFKWPLALCLLVLLWIEWWVYYRGN